MIRARRLACSTVAGATLVVLLLALPAAGQTDLPGPHPLRLADLVAEIRKQNPRVAGATERVAAARIRVPRARSLSDPSVTAMVENVPATFRGGMPMVRLQAQQMLPWPGKRDRMARVAEREADVVEARAGTVVLDAVTEAKGLYFELYVNAASRRINREQRAVVDTLVEVALGRLAAGVGAMAHHEVLKMQTEASMLDDALVMLGAERREMSAMLNALLDRPAEAPIGEPVEVVTPSLPLDRKRLVPETLARRPELREMAAMRGAELAMADAARREYWPDLMFGGLYDIKTGGEQDTIGAMVGLNVPIWIGSSQRLDVEAAEARARAVEREQAAMAAMARAEVERGLAMTEAADLRLRILDAEIVPRAQQTFDAALRAFPSGGVDTLELLDSLRTVSTQRLARIAVAADRELALIALERAVGAPLGEIK